jgi:hypothetical protein
MLALCRYSYAWFQFHCRHIQDTDTCGILLFTNLLVMIFSLMSFPGSFVNELQMLAPLTHRSVTGHKLIQSDAVYIIRTRLHKMRFFFTVLRGKPTNGFPRFSMNLFPSSKLHLNLLDLITLTTCKLCQWQSYSSCINLEFQFNLFILGINIFRSASFSSTCNNGFYLEHETSASCPYTQ